MVEPMPHDEASALRRILELCDPAAGDDAAVLATGADGLCISTDPTIRGVHAPAAIPAHALGRRAAARAASDLAAMGALPRAMTCAVLVPDDGWADAVAAIEGVVERGSQLQLPLVGGDLCRTDGSLGLVVTVLGRRGSTRAGRSAFVLRAGARIGDLLVVTGALGAAARAIDQQATDLPEPPDRLRAGTALARHVSAMVDVSDGVVRDAGNIASASRVMIDLDIDALPVVDGVDRLRAASFGDDYELLATIPPERLDAARRTLEQADPQLRLTIVGRVVDAGSVVRCFDAGRAIEPPSGFLHS